MVHTRGKILIILCDELPAVLLITEIMKCCVSCMMTSRMCHFCMGLFGRNWNSARIHRWAMLSPYKAYCSDYSGINGAFVFQQRQGVIDVMNKVNSIGNPNRARFLYGNGH